jgi:hypothetical protein
VDGHEAAVARRERELAKAAIGAAGGEKLTERDLLVMDDEAESRVPTTRSGARPTMPASRSLQ